MRFHQIFLASLAFALRTKAAPSSGDFELRQLTEDNFKASTARGLWLVEHFSPKCSHCRAFAPTWTQLAEEKQHLERLSGFHMAQVNCLAQGDLCNTNGIKFYPQLMLYSDGTPLPNYSGDRSYADLSKYIDEQSGVYARKIQGIDVDASVAPKRPNPDGEVLEVDPKGFEVLKADGPVFMEFYAPWCGHCKKLRPIYEKLADKLKGKMPVAAINCEEHKTFCRSQEIGGYPTLRLLNRADQQSYMGARTVDAMKKFAMGYAQIAGMQPIKHENLAEIIKTEDSFFLYLQNFDTTSGDLELVKNALNGISGVATYTSADPELYRHLSIANPPPTSVLLAFSSHEPQPVGSLSFPTEREPLERFLARHRYPTLVELSGKSHDDIMKAESRAVVVLGALHKGSEGEKEREKLMQVARAWKRGGRPFVQPIRFAWIDGEKWSGWLRQSYGIRKKDLPVVVVVDPPMSEYYDMTIEGNKLSFDGAAIFSVLEGFYQHFLRPKRVESTLAWGSRSATKTLIGLSHLGEDHPFAAFLIVVGSVAVFVFLLQRCIPRDPREGKEGSSRLD